jgi:transposase
MSKLLSLSDTANYYLYRKRVKMSRSFDGLAALIRTELESDIVNGDVFIFLNRNRTMIKVFDEGSFQLPMIAGENISFKMSSDQMMYMLSAMTLKDGGYVRAELYEPLHGKVV